MKLNENIQELITKLNRNRVIKNELKELYKINQDKAWRKIEKMNNRKFLFVRKISVASASVVAALLFLYFGVFNDNENKSLVVENKIEKIDYGRSYIMTSSGEKIEFEADTVKAGIIQYEKSQKFVKCEATENATLDSYNTIVVPKGETLKVELSDGTLVWLNSDSRLIYPSNFKKESRVVELLGEGYFEVTSDAKAPFMVKGNGLNVNVTGTKFNISNYNDQVEKYVTLVEGAVDVEIDNNRGKLTPSEQFRYNTITKIGSTVKVNPMLYTSWTKDRIFFKDMPLEDMIIVFNRWYAVNIECQDTTIVKQIFTGEIYRYDSPEDIITFITKAANLKWKTNDKGFVIIY